MLVDLGWQAYAAGALRARYADSTIKHDTGKFPSGMASLATYIRSKGLHYAAYTDCGYETCGGMTEGSRGFEYKDMRTFAEWGADYVKVDYCGIDGRSAPAVYSMFRDAIRATGRPMVFSICNWGMQNVQQWGDTVGNLWRTTGDIDTTWASVISVFDRTVAIAQYSGPGHWNDPDMLQVGNGSLTPDENRAHFTMWCMLAAPLMLGNDLRAMPQSVMDIVGNTEAIAVDQDSLGQSARKVRDDGDAEVYVRMLRDSTRAVMLLNRGTTAATFAVNWSELGLGSSQTARVRDLWQHRDMGTFSSSYTADVPAHGVAMVTVATGPATTTAARTVRERHPAGQPWTGATMYAANGAVVSGGRMAAGGRCSGVVVVTVGGAASVRVVQR
jgi:alpha-galactosidase